MRWIQNEIPTFPITNFKNNWTNGAAIVALFQSIAPGLCGMWNEKNAFKCTQDAMELAEEWLDIQMYITPDELFNDYISEKALITYLSQFIVAKLRSGSPLRAKRISNR